MSANDNLKDRLAADIKTALLAGEREKADVLRGLKSAILYEEVAQKKRDEGLDDASIEQIIARESKKRDEAAVLYEKGGSQERADKERWEKTVIAVYLPEQLTNEELNAIVAEVLAVEGSDAHVGKVIGAVKVRVGNSADGARVASAVQQAVKGRT